MGSGFGTTTTTNNNASSSHSSSGSGVGGAGSGGGAGDADHSFGREHQGSDGISASTAPPPPRDSTKRQSGAGSAPNSSPPAKKSRRSVQKRVVTVPIADSDGGSRPKGSGEGSPPLDSWAWRKYGQKPIKGSPYPRGYYRCSSSKGCPARKQVERSRVDPTMLVVTYASDHNHPWPLPKNHQQNHNPNNSSSNSQKPKLAPAPEPEREETPLAPNSQLMISGPETPVTTTNTSSSSREEASFSMDLGEESSLMLMTASADELCWYPDMTETSLHSDLAFMLPVSYDEVAVECGGSGGSSCVKEEEEEEDSLFAGLGELPGCSVVLRRGLGGRGCSLGTSSWCGNNG